MVRMFLCQPCKQLKSFTSHYEPTAICCQEGNYLFVSSANGTVHVYNVYAETIAEVHKFISSGISLKMVYCNRKNLLISLEMKFNEYKPSVTSRNNTCIVRVYNNWDCATSNKVYTPLPIGYTALPEKCESEGGKFNIIELTLEHGVVDISVCLFKSNIAAAALNKVYVFAFVEVPVNSGIDKVIDYYPLLEVESKFRIRNVSLALNWLAYSSRKELRVIQVFVKKYDNDGVHPGEDVSELLESCVVNDADTQNDNAVSSSKLKSDFIVWNFDYGCSNIPVTAVSDDNKHAFLTNGNNGQYLWDNVINLDLIKREVPYVEKGSGAKEVLGPCDEVVGHPVRISSLGANENASFITLLYRRFESSELSIAGNVKTLHSLQWMPVFFDSITDATKWDSSLASSLQLPLAPSLLVMSLFVSTGKNGFLYDVSKNVKCVAKYSYTSDCISAIHTISNVHVVTKNGFETYTSRLFPLALDQFQSHGDCLLRSHSNSGSFVEHNYNERWKLPGDSGCDFDEQCIEIQAPVYSCKQLHPGCVWEDVDICLVDMHSISNILSSTRTSTCNILLTKSLQKSRPKQPVEQLASGPWHVYVFEKPSVSSCFETMMQLIEGNEFSNPNIYYQILCEAHLMARLHIFHGISHVEEESLNALVKSSALKIADFFARCDAGFTSHVLIKQFYEIAGYTFSEVLERFMLMSNDKNKQYGVGMIEYFNTIIFADQPLILLETEVDFILTTYSLFRPTLLSKICMDSQIKGIPTELALTYLTKFKGDYKIDGFSPYDHLCLAFLYMNNGEASFAEKVLEEISETSLQTACISHDVILFSDTITSLGQLVKKRFPELFINVLVSLFDCGKLGAEVILGFYQKQIDGATVTNFKVCQVFEMLLKDISRKKHFHSIAVVLVNEYVSDLVKGLTAADWDSLHQHIPKGSGHFATRFKWLDEMAPFTGETPCPQDCTLSQQHTTSRKHLAMSYPYKRSPSNRNSPHALSSPIKRGEMDQLKKRSYCPCCCCSETLLKFQAMLCSKYCRKDLALHVLKTLENVSFVGKDSLVMLCLPKAGMAGECVDYMLANYIKLTIQYAKDLFDWKVQWQTLLGHTLALLKDQTNEWNKQELQNVLKGVLLRLTRAYTAAEFLAFLPQDGNLTFFLPFIVECWQYNQGGKLKKDLIDNATVKS